MKKKTLLLTFIIFLSACAAPTPQNKWKYEATAALSSYKKHFLENKLQIAKIDLFHARSSASQSADLKTRIDIELNVCALHVSILKESKCEDLTSLIKLEPNRYQEAYLHLLQNKITEDDTNRLPPQYKEFALAYLKQDKTKINKTISDIKPITSKLVASALAVDMIDNDNIEVLIDELSFYGYKNPLLKWLAVQMQKETDSKKKAILKAKIELLNSN